MFGHWQHTSQVKYSMWLHDSKSVYISTIHLWDELGDILKWTYAVLSVDPSNLATKIGLILWSTSSSSRLIDWYCYHKRQWLLLGDRGHPSSCPRSCRWHHLPALCHQLRRCSREDELCFISRACLHSIARLSGSSGFLMRRLLSSNYNVAFWACTPLEFPILWSSLLGRHPAAPDHTFPPDSSSVQFFDFQLKKFLYILNKCCFCSSCPLCLSCSAPSGRVATPTPFSSTRRH